MKHAGFNYFLSEYFVLASWPNQCWRCIRAKREKRHWPRSLAFLSTPSWQQCVGRCSDYLMHAPHLRMTKWILKLYTSLILFSRKAHSQFNSNTSPLPFEQNKSRSTDFVTIHAARTEILCWRHDVKLLFILHVLQLTMRSTSLQAIRRHPGSSRSHVPLHFRWPIRKVPFTCSCSIIIIQ